MSQMAFDRRAQVAFLAALWGICGVVSVYLATRIYQAFRPPEFQDQLLAVRPPTQVHVFDPLLGYKPSPGRFEIAIKTPDGQHERAFVAEMGDDGYRLTSRRPAKFAGKPEIWILGCSATWGWAVDNDDTYPWMVQSEFPDYRVLNLGVNGYGNVHALLQMQQAEARGAELPAVAVFAYSSFHLTRNVAAPSRLYATVRFTKKRRRTIDVAELKHARAQLDAAGKLVLDLVDFNSHVGQRDPNYRTMIHVTRAIFTEIRALCARNGIAPILMVQVADLDGPVVSHCRRLGFVIVDSRVDVTDPRYNLQPVDGHPNRKAHRLYADSLIAPIKQLLVTR